MLIRWHKRHQEPELTQKIFDEEGSVSIPIWEQSNEESMAWTVASHLKGEPWVLLPIDMGEVEIEFVNEEHEAMLSQEVKD